ncbi:MAG: hypothetical protein IPJ01_10550 [Micavibrio sp.]|nr:hypothetical protein [Micavibrio sp.]
MTEIKVKAIFKGQNGSMGFIKGKSYNLTLTKYKDGGLLAEDDFNHCEYGSFIAFLKNWDNVCSITTKITNQK